MKNLTRSLTLATLLGIASVANAQVWNEASDAGATPQTAQITMGDGPLTTILGTLDPATDVDVFQINVTDVNVFSITFNGTALSADNDMKVFVMDAAGNLVITDDDGGPGFLPQINVGDLSGQTPGIFTIAYGLFNMNAIGTTPVTGFTVSPNPLQTGTVQMNFTGASFAVSATAAVPEPGSVALLVGAGIGGVMLRRRKK